jgi:glycosyltransferase involved in cell wall biosynthesis
MTISGFTMARNAIKYYFPLRESILSALPITDEFIVALGAGDADDSSIEILKSIDSPKVKMFPRQWDEQHFKDGRIFRHETNFALEQCSGDWCLYLQADEVIHEDDWATIERYAQFYQDDKQVDGFLFRYYHFWGDYDHYLPYHGWYPQEIRLVRNRAGIYSHSDAQSFRKVSDEKLNVIAIPAAIYHYGWVRPPEVMTSKKKEQDGMHWGKDEAAKAYERLAPVFDYGPLGRLPLFKGSHPKVMAETIARISWKDQLNYGKKYTAARARAKHEVIKYRVLSFVEQKLCGGRQLFGYKNWNLLKDTID